jgi:hypothetical protein
MNRFLRVLLCLLPLCACATSRPKGAASQGRLFVPSAASEKLPYEKHHRWKDWSVWVKALPVQPGHMVWYEVQAGRVSNEKEDILRRTTYDADGEVQQTWLSDLKGAGWPVLILFMSDTGKGHYGFLRLIECRGDGFRNLPVPNTPHQLLEGYRGGDVWDWKDGELVRQFPLYVEGDEPGTPQGGKCIIWYKWIKGKWHVRYQHEPQVASSADSALVE